MLRQQNPAQAGSVTTATQQFDQQFPRFERDAANRAKAERTKYKNGRETINEVRDTVEKIGEIVDFLKCWFAYKDPVRVTVQAQACTGGLGCELVAYPADEVKWKITEAEKGLIKRATDKVEKIANFLTGLFAPLGNIEVSMKAFEGADVSLVCQWKELTKDAPRPGKKIYQCNPKLELQFNVEELVSLEIKASIPLARLLDMVVAGSGYAVQKACNWFGLTAQAYISVELKVGITLGVRLNEYWEGEPVVSITFTFKFALGMELRYKNNLHIDGKAAVEATATFDNPKFEPDALIAVDFKWGIKAGFEGQIYVSIWWFEYNQSGSHYPESWKYEMKDPATLRPLKPLLALVKN